MKNMEFMDFVQILHPIIGGSSNQGAFVKTLFEVIVTDEGQSALDEQSEVTYRSYFNGSTGISRIAKKISPYIETENFVIFIQEFSDETVASLCDSFREYLPGIDNFNAGRQLADLFFSILKAAAGAKRKSTPRGAKGKAATTPHDVFSGKILASAKTMSDAWDKAMQAKADGKEGTGPVEAEGKDGEGASGAAENVGTTDSRVQIIEKATVVNQYGENCVHIDHVDTFKL